MKLSKTLVVPMLIVILAVSSTAAYASAGTGTQPSGSISVSPSAGEGILAANEPVTFEGMWGGACTVLGTIGGSYETFRAGTFRMTVDGQADIPGYCIDVDHSISSGDSWTADVDLATEAALCEANWIIATYSRNNPGPGLSADEEGVAIQAALWYYVEGFNPVWNGNTDYWCGSVDVKDRADDIIAAASGQCGLFPVDLTMTASPDDPADGETVDLTATVLDQFGAGYQGQLVSFGSLQVSLSPDSGVSNASGIVASSFVYPEPELVFVKASMTAQSAPWTVNDVAAAKQRILIVRPYDTEVEIQVPPPNPTAVEIAAFSATVVGRSVQVRWETASELDTLGFNLHRASTPNGLRTKLNANLIMSQAAPGSPTGAVYLFGDEEISQGSTYYYWIEALDVDGQSAFQGPVSATVLATSRLLLVRPRMAPAAPSLNSR